MKPVSKIISKVVPLMVNDINTDQITPAGTMLTTKRTDFAGALFANWRYDATGKPKPDFVLNRPEMQGRAILRTGYNFGSGSSRECAVWALVDWGIRAVLSQSFADIFRKNAIENGLVPAIVTPMFQEKLEADPDAEVTVDVEKGTISLPDGTSERFPMDPFDRLCLLKGMNKLDFLLDQEEAIAAFEEARRC